MNKVCLIITIILCLNISSYAQNVPLEQPKVIKGVIKDYESSGMSCIIFSLGKRVQLKIDSGGHFNQTVIVGSDYELLITNMSNGLTKKIDMKTENSYEINLGVIEAFTNTTSLKEVAIVSHSLVVKKDLAKTTYQIQNYKDFSGDNLKDFFQKLPGFFVYDNAISYNGTSKTRIYVNGKEMKFTDSKAKLDFLSSIKVSGVKEIEAISPSAKSKDDSYVLNINTKALENGISINPILSFSTGKYSSSSAGVFAQAKQNKLSETLYFNAGYENEYATSKQFREVMQRTLQASINSLEKKKNTYTQLDIDYAINHKVNLGVSVSASTARSHGNDDAQYISSFKYQDTIIKNQSHSTKSTNYLVGSTYLIYKIDTLGQELRASVDYNNYSATQDNSYMSQLYDQVNSDLGNVTNQSLINSRLNVISGTIDYTKQNLKQHL